MNIKNRINASRVAYRKAKNIQSKNSLYLQDLINSQISINQQLLRNVQKQFQQNEMEQPSQQQEDDNEKEKPYLDNLEDNISYKEFLEGILGSFSSLQLQKLAIWKRTFTKINLSSRSKILQTHKKVVNGMNDLKEGFYQLHNLNLEKQKIKKQRTTRIAEQKRKQQEIRLKEDENNKIQKKLLEQEALSTRRQKKLREQIQNNQKQFLEKLKNSMLSRQELKERARKQQEDKQLLEKKIEETKISKVIPIQKELTQNRKLLKFLIEDKTLFLLALLKNGFYQTNGLQWIFVQISCFWKEFMNTYDLQNDSNQTIQEKLTDSISQKRQQILSQPFIDKIHQKLLLQQVNFPEILDLDSKKFLIKIFKEKYSLQKYLKSSNIKEIDHLNNDLHKIYETNHHVSLRKNKDIHPESQPNFIKRLSSVTPSTQLNSSLDFTQQQQHKKLVRNPEKSQQSTNEQQKNISKSKILANLMQKKSTSLSVQSKRKNLNHHYLSALNRYSILQKPNQNQQEQKDNASTVPLFPSSSNQANNQILPNIFAHNHNVHSRDGKSLNFNTKKIYLNTKDILSRWIQTSQKVSQKKTSLMKNSVEAKFFAATRNKSEQSEIQVQTKFEENKELKQSRNKSRQTSPEKIKPSFLKNCQSQLEQSLKKVSPTQTNNVKIEIQSRNQHKKRSFPMSNYINNSSVRSPKNQIAFNLSNSQQNVIDNDKMIKQKQKKRINNLYKIEDSELMSRLIFGVQYASKGQVGEIQYLSWH